MVQLPHKTNRLILFRDTICVCCENRTEQIIYIYILLYLCDYILYYMYYILYGITVIFSPLHQMVCIVTTVIKVVKKFFFFFPTR